MPRCPTCNSEKSWKDGIRQTGFGDVQRYLCRDCGFRFSINLLGKSFNMTSSRGFTCQIGAIPKAHGQVINLAEVEPLKEGPAGATASSEGETLRYLIWLRNQGYSNHTVRSRSNSLKGILRKSADLNDPESVKKAIANSENWSSTSKLLATSAYDSFLKWQGKTWIPPIYRQQQKIPFIPTEEEIDALIASCGKKTATMLQLLKETGMRLGEAFQLEWKDIDFERKLITVNHPEKGSNARILRISNKLADMLTTQPKKSQKTFGDGSIKTFETNFWKQRKNAAKKLQNPRLLSISYHTFRHWKATMEYHKTHDIFHVQRLLGHKCIQNTSIYITLENSLFLTEDSQFHTSVAKTVEEARKLLEAGFEYALEIDGTKIFRKRK